MSKKACITLAFLFALSILWGISPVVHEAPSSSPLFKTDTPLPSYESKKVSPNSQLIEGKLYFNRGILELGDKDHGDLQAARQYFKKAQRIFESLKADDDLAKTYIRQAGVCLRISHLISAEIYLNEADKLKKNERTALSLSLAKTKLERLKGNKEQALANALQAEKIAQESGSSKDIQRVKKLIEILQASRKN